MIPVFKADEFLADVERQFEWYTRHASFDIAERYLKTVEASCQLLRNYPDMGPLGGFTSGRLTGWRYFVLSRPFSKHLLFYVVESDRLVMRRALHGHRDLPRHLLQFL